jgi:hypothetical protein
MDDPVKAQDIRFQAGFSAARKKPRGPPRCDGPRRYYRWAAPARPMIGQTSTIFSPRAT